MKTQQKACEYPLLSKENPYFSLQKKSAGDEFIKDANEIFNTIVNFIFSITNEKKTEVRKTEHTVFLGQEKKRNFISVYSDFILGKCGSQKLQSLSFSQFSIVLGAEERSIHIGEGEGKMQLVYMDTKLKPGAIGTCIFSQYQLAVLTGMVRMLINEFFPPEKE
jgi:hypothetical protein